jgi:hypothetical protein
VKALREAEVAAGMLVRASKTAVEPPPIVTRRDLLLRQVQLLRAFATAGGLGRGGLEPGAFEVTDVHRLFALTVQVLAPAKLCGAKPGETVVVLRADGKRLAGIEVDPTDREAFVRAVTPSLLAPDVLAARTTNVPPELRKAYERLVAIRNDPDRDGEEVARLCAQLRANLPAAAPVIVPEPGQLDGFLASQLLAPRPPDGTQEQMVLTGDPCPACGMAYVPQHLNSVLKLLGP